MWLFRLGVIGLCFWAQSAEAIDPVARLRWEDPAPAGSEAVLTLRAVSGSALVTLRADVAPGATSHDFTLPPLPRQTQSMQAGLVHAGRVMLQGPVQPAADALWDPLSSTLSPGRAVLFSDLWECDDGIQRRSMHPTEDGPVFAPVAANTPHRSRHGDDTRGSPSIRPEFAANRALFEVPETGQRVTCAPALQPPVLPIVAFGQNPDWQLSLTQTQAVFELPALETPAIEGLQISAPRDGRMRFQSDGFALDLRDSACRIRRIDLPYPITANLDSAQPARAVEGCAGDPLEFLAGVPWRVENLLGLPLELPVGSEITMQIADGQISGRGTCNRYLGRADASARQLSLRDLGTTRLTCNADLRNLELRFLDALEAATGFEISPTGRLTLRAGVLPVLTARRQVSAR